ncbi:MAG: adenosylhomocysteinase, partial [Patescibacteria group bacterium]
MSAGEDIADPRLATEGKKRVEWAERDMPVLRQVRAEFEKSKPFNGMRFSACLHVTAETANLMRTLKAGGADVLLTASNPLSTQDDVAAALTAEYGIPTYAVRGEDRDTFFRHFVAAIGGEPVITMDDGADLVSTIHQKHAALIPKL